MNASSLNLFALLGMTSVREGASTRPGDDAVADAFAAQLGALTLTAAAAGDGAAAGEASVTLDALGDAGAGAGTGKAHSNTADDRPVTARVTDATVALLAGVGGAPSMNPVAWLSSGVDAPAPSAAPDRAASSVAPAPGRGEVAQAPAVPSTAAATGTTVRATARRATDPPAAVAPSDAATRAAAPPVPDPTQAGDMPLAAVTEAGPPDRAGAQPGEDAQIVVTPASTARRVRVDGEAGEPIGGRAAAAETTAPAVPVALAARAALARANRRRAAVRHEGDARATRPAGRAGTRPTDGPAMRPVSDAATSPSTTRLPGPPVARPLFDAAPVPGDATRGGVLRSMNDPAAPTPTTSHPEAATAPTAARGLPAGHGAEPSAAPGHRADAARGANARARATRATAGASATDRLRGAFASRATHRDAPGEGAPGTAPPTAIPDVGPEPTVAPASTMAATVAGVASGHATAPDLALVADAAGAPITDTAHGRADVASAMARVLRRWARGAEARDGVHRAHIRIHPPELGSVALRLHVRDRRVTLDALVEHPDVKAILDAHQAGVRAALGEHGFNLDGFQVGVSHGGASGFGGRFGEGGFGDGGHGAAGAAAGAGDEVGSPSPWRQPAVISDTRVNVFA